MPATIISVAGTPKLKLYVMDCGRGKPIKLERISSGRSISIDAGKESDQDLEIGVSLTATEMQLFVSFLNKGHRTPTLRLFFFLYVLFHVQYFVLSNEKSLHYHCWYCVMCCSRIQISILLNVYSFIFLRIKKQSAGPVKDGPEKKTGKNRTDMCVVGPVFDLDHSVTPVPVYYRPIRSMNCAYRRRRWFSNNHSWRKYEHVWGRRPTY